MKKFLLLIILFLPMYTVLKAQTLSEAEKAYAENNFQKAAEIYEALLKTEETPQIYYNLGNCYYRLQFPAKALLNYERAALLDPADKDVRANIEFIERQLLPAGTRATEFFFVTWWKGLRNSFNLHAWIVGGIVSFILFLASSSAYLFSRKIMFRKAGFFAALFFLAVCALSNHFAYVQYRALSVRNTALISEPEAIVRSAPSDTGMALTTLPVGLKIKITDESLKDWKEIEFNDGKVGWIKAEELEVI